MSPWDTASGVIAAAFADPEPLAYTQSGVTFPVKAIRSDVAADAFPGPGATLRKVVYEIRQADLPAPASKKDSFVHRGRIWRAEDITRRDDVGAWELVVVDQGAAS